MAQMMKFVFYREENIVKKGENAGKSIGSTISSLNNK